MDLMQKTIYWIMHNIEKSRDSRYLIQGWVDVSGNESDVADTIYQLPDAPFPRDRARHVLKGMAVIDIPDNKETACTRYPFDFGSSVLPFEIIDALAWQIVGQAGLICPTIDQAIGLLQGANAPAEVIQAVGMVSTEIVQPIIEQYIAVVNPVEVVNG
jgi:hypothetical protein